MSEPPEEGAPEPGKTRRTSESRSLDNSKRGGRFGAAKWHQAICQTAFNALQKSLLHAMATFADWETGICYPSVRRLANAAGIRSVRTVQKYLREFADQGVLQIMEQSSGGRTNIYRLMLDGLKSAEPDSLEPRTGCAVVEADNPAADAGSTAQRRRDNCASDATNPATDAHEQDHEQNQRNITSSNTNGDGGGGEVEQVNSKPGVEDLGERIAALGEIGINEPTRSRLAELPWNSPARIERIFEHASSQEDIRNPAGFVARLLEQPDDPERSGPAESARKDSIRDLLPEDPARLEKYAVAAGAAISLLDGEEQSAVLLHFDGLNGVARHLSINSIAVGPVDTARILKAAAQGST